MKSSFLDKLIQRMERLDPESLQSFVLKLARERGFLETLFNTIQEGILVTDEQGHIQFANLAAGRLLGTDPQQALGQPVSRYLRELDWDKIWSADREEWNKVLSYEWETFYPRHGFLNFYIVPVIGPEQKRVSGLAIILRDITETRARTEHAIESEKLSALTMLAAGVAHEIGNPLNSLNIHLQLMEREIHKLSGDSARRLQADLQVARAEITRLDGIVNQFLRAVRPTRPDRQPVAVDEVVKESLTLMERELRDRDILVEQEPATDLPRILLDSNQMKQAFYNILKNALQAMAAGGILRVQTELSGSDPQYVVVSFHDTGPGIRAEQIGQIFEPYFTTKPKGTGLGLLIVQRIVRDHGGLIEVESHVGRGTTVRIKLPVHEKRVRLLEASTRPQPATPSEHSP